MGKSRYLLFLTILSTLLLARVTFAGEIDILVEKLVGKGVLTPGEGQKIVTETREEIRKQLAKGEVESVPNWVQKTKVKGDFRLRYQWEDKTGKEERDRGRIRFRVGGETKVTDQFKVGFGLATGGSGPRSTNQTLDETFSTPDLRLDYAFAQYDSLNWLIWGGKYKGIKKALWRPSDLLWDSDIRPEGIGAIFNQKLQSGLDLFANTGFWILEEEKEEASDPVMFVVQPGLKWKFADNMHLKAALAYYLFDAVKGATLTNSEETNTLENEVLKYDYDSWAPSLELGIKEPLGGKLPYLAIFGDYVYNPDPEESGYLVGLKFGDKKVKKSGQWQFKYMYRYLEKDAWLDTFPDSDVYGGETDVQGHEVIFNYGLAKNVTLGLDYYHSEKIDEDKEQDLVQADLVFKF